MQFKECIHLKILGSFSTLILITKTNMIVYTNVCSAVGALKHLKRFLPFKIFCIFLKANVFTIIDYCLPIWGVQTEIDKQRLQTKINQVILNFSEPPKWMKHCKYKPYIENEILEKAGVLSLSERMKFYTAKITFYILQTKFIVETISIPCTMYNLNMFTFKRKGKTRSSCKNLLEQPYKWKSASYTKPFRYREIELWKKLRYEFLQNDMSLKMFENALNDYLTNERKHVHIMKKPP
jgi:hypothetical protein